MPSKTVKCTHSKLSEWYWSGAIVLAIWYSDSKGDPIRVSEHQNLYRWLRWQSVRLERKSDVSFRQRLRAATFMYHVIGICARRLLCLLKIFVASLWCGSISRISRSHESCSQRWSQNDVGLVTTWDFIGKGFFPVLDATIVLKLPKFMAGDTL